MTGTNNMTTIKDLDVKSVIVILDYYNQLPDTFKKAVSFGTFVEHNVTRIRETSSRFCQYAINYIAGYDETKPFCRFGFLDESGELVLEPTYNGTTTCEHPFYHLYESEEAEIREILKK